MGQMQVDFQQTTRAIAFDRQRAGIDQAIIALLSLLFLASAAWLFVARLPLYEMSSTARVEVSQQGSPLEAAVAGRVARTNLKLGQPVKAGDVLVEFDAELMDKRIEGDLGEIETLTSHLAIRRKRTDIAERMLSAQAEQSQIGIRQARARVDQARAAAEFSRQIVGQREQLFSKGFASRTDYMTARRDMQQNDALAAAAEFEVQRLETQAAVDQGEASVRLAELNSLVAELEAAIAAKRASVENLQKERQNFRILASSDGLLGETADIRPGSFVQVGTRLATIVPTGDLRIVAVFPPAAAIGRVRPGQIANLRLAGFPWAQYGTVEATVLRVGSEVRNNTVRVEFSLDGAGRSSVPLQHGLPGEVAVTIAEISPWHLIVRSAVQFIHPPRAVPPAQP
jgi:membrane fusion protein, adhesin transport system